MTVKSLVVTGVVVAVVVVIVVVGDETKTDQSIVREVMMLFIIEVLVVTCWP